MANMQSGKLNYQLLDFGNGSKLERFGDKVMIRPEILAVGQPKLPESEWNRMATLRFIETEQMRGFWQTSQQEANNWECVYHCPPFHLKLQLRKGINKHVGLFPEQEKHWNFLAGKLQKNDRFLNLFAYTGASSLVAASAGADVYHVDSARSVINWAAGNAQINDISSIHWVCEDALKFTERENKRKHKYHGIIMDPPIFGKGSGGENRKLNDMLNQLVTNAGKLLHPGGFLVLNTYSPTVDIEGMREICIKNKLEHNDSGWLSVNTPDGRSLKLSKYVVASASKLTGQ